MISWSWRNIFVFMIVANQWGRKYSRVLVMPKHILNIIIDLIRDVLFIAFMDVATKCKSKASHVLGCAMQERCKEIKRSVSSRGGNSNDSREVSQRHPISQPLNIIWNPARKFYHWEVCNSRQSCKWSYLDWSCCSLSGDVPVCLSSWTFSFPRYACSFCFVGWWWSLRRATREGRIYNLKNGHACLHSCSCVEGSSSKQGRWNSSPHHQKRA